MSTLSKKTLLGIHDTMKTLIDRLCDAGIPTAFCSMNGRQTNVAYGNPAITSVFQDNLVAISNNPLINERLPIPSDEELHRTLLDSSIGRLRQMVTQLMSHFSTQKDKWKGPKPDYWPRAREFKSTDKGFSVPALIEIIRSIQSYRRTQAAVLGGQHGHDQPASEAGGQINPDDPDIGEPALDLNQSPLPSPLHGQTENPSRYDQGRSRIIMTRRHSSSPENVASQPGTSRSNRDSTSQPGTSRTGRLIIPSDSDSSSPESVSHAARCKVGKVRSNSNHSSPESVHPMSHAARSKTNSSKRKRLHTGKVRSNSNHSNPDSVVPMSHAARSKSNSSKRKRLPSKSTQTANSNATDWHMDNFTEEAELFVNSSSDSSPSRVRTNRKRTQPNRYTPSKYI